MATRTSDSINNLRGPTTVTNLKFFLEPRNLYQQLVTKFIRNVNLLNLELRNYQLRHLDRTQKKEGSNKEPAGIVIISADTRFTTSWIEVHSTLDTGYCNM